MAITITVTDETNTVTFTATDAYNQSYQPVTPDPGATEVVEEMEITFIGGNAAVAANMTELERLFGYAYEATNGMMLRQVWFKVTLDSEVWRSELYDGKIIPTAEWLRGERALGQRDARIVIRRAPWFEANAEVAAPISNAHGSSSDLLTGVPIYNHDDGGHDNYLDIGTINGDLPAPAVFSLFLFSRANVEIFTGIASYCDRANLVQALEGGSGTAGAGVTPTVNTDASDSNNNYVALAWSGATEMNLQYWSLTTAQATAFAGRVFRPLIRLHSAIGGSTRFWISIAAHYNAGGTLEKIWQSEEMLVALTDKAQVLPPVQLPPWPVGFFSSAGFELSVMCRCEAAGAHTVNLDCLMLLPCDSYLRLIPTITTYPDTAVRFDSQIRGFSNNSYAIETHTAEGPGLWLVPGQSQRLCVVMRQGTGWDITRNPTLYLSYRPRKRTI